MSKTPTVKETNVPTLSSADLDKLMQNSFDNIDSNAVSMPYWYQNNPTYLNQVVQTT
jgi:hypothetical protein